MNYKAFPDEYWSTITKTIGKLKDTTQQPLVAAFDADGTLWDTDLGENFFQYQIDQKLVPLPADPFQYYLDKKKTDGDPRPAYVWLAQINSGKSLQQVRQWADDAFKTILPSPIFSEQRKLIELLQKNNVQVYIVTASIKWAVEPGARALGLTNDQVLGIETEIIDGIISSKEKLPITYRQGKADALLKHTHNLHPFLAAGNTTGDLELLQCATHIRLAVSAASRDDRIFKSEKELQDIAIQNNWLHHRFI